MITARQFRHRVKTLFRKKVPADLFRPVFFLEKQTITWRCTLCDAEQTIPMAKEGHVVDCMCLQCGKKHQVSLNGIAFRQFLFPRKEEVIFVTRATVRELEAKIKGDVSIIVRPKLIYHTKYECEFAHKDYVVDGVLIALNTGVIRSVPHDFLNLCERCAGVEYVPCPRCGGKGVIPIYRHIQNGICFRCWGVGIERVIEVTVKAIN